MRLGVLIPTLAVLSTASAYQLELSDYWSKYGAVMVMTYCGGEKMTKTYTRQVLKTLQECDEVSAEAYTDQPIESLETANWNAIFNEFVPRFRQQNLFSPEKAERISYVKKKISQQIARFRCTMQKLNVTDRTNNINKTAIVEAYEMGGLPAQLLRDLLAGVNQCYDLTKCLPRDQSADSPIPIDVVLVKTFLNCERYMRNWACLKNYLKPNVAAGDFDFSGADGTLDFLPDDEARAVAIALANELVGGDDYGLYE